ARAPDRSDRRALALLAQQPRLVTLPVAGFLSLALVGLALALGEAEFAFGKAALVEIDAERHDGHALALDEAAQLVLLLAVEQQLARPAGLVVLPRRLVFRDVGADEVERAVALGGIGFVDARLTLAQHLDLGAEQHHAGLDRILDQVVVTRPAILRGIFIGVAAHHALNRAPLARAMSARAESLLLMPLARSSAA